MTWTHTVTGGHWRQRIGRRLIVDPEGHPAYPWHGIRATEVVVLIENDPYSPNRLWSYSPNRLWSCVINRNHITPIETP